MAGDNIPLERRGQEDGNRPAHGKPHRETPDGLADYYVGGTQQRQQLFTLYKDMYELCRDLDCHFLSACLMSQHYNPPPDGVDAGRVTAFQSKIESYERSLSEVGNDVIGGAAVIAQAFADTSEVKTLWGPVNSQLGESPGGNKQFNNKPPWTTWVIELDEIGSRLPELLVRMRRSPTPVLADDQAWRAVRQKLAFIEEVIIYAYRNDWATWPRKRPDVGKTVNAEFVKAGIPANAAEKFIEFEPTRSESQEFMSSSRQQILTNSLFAFTVAAVIIAGVGFKYAKGTKGKLDDQGFWFLLASCVLQQLGVVVLWLTATYTLSWWEYTLYAAATVFTVAPPILWTLIPLEYCLELALAGGALQNFIILQSIFAVAHQKVKHSKVGAFGLRQNSYVSALRIRAQVNEDKGLAHNRASFNRLCI